MHALRFISICCCINLLNAVNLKIDGLIDLDNWSYEYKVVIHPDDKAKSGQRQAAQLRTGPVSDQGLITSEKQISDKKQENKHNEKEKIKTIDTKRHAGHQNHDDLNQTIIILISDALKASKPNIDDLVITAATSKRRKKREHKHHKLVPSIKDASSIDVSSTEEDTSKSEKTVARIRDNFRITQHYGLSIEVDEGHDKIDHKRAKEYHNTGKADQKTGRAGKTDHKGYVYHNEQADRYQTDNENHQSKINHFQNNDHDSKGTDHKSRDKKNTQAEVITVRTNNIYSDASQVSQNANVTNFINHLYKQTLKVFDDVKNKSENYYFIKEVDMLSRSYKHKFNEFIKMTEHQTIKTRLGTQKVILNTIDLSNHILKRLLNYMVVDMDNRGVLRNNADAPNILQEEIEKLQMMEFSHACRKFGICRSGYGCSKFFVDLIDVQLKMENNKFSISYNAFTEVLKNTQFDVLYKNTSILLEKLVDRMELMHENYVRAMFMIAKNTIVNRNKPLVAGKHNNGDKINPTLAFFEIIDIFEQHLPGNDTNLLEWGDIKTKLQDFSDDKKMDAVNVWGSFVAHIKNALSGIDKGCKDILNDKLCYLLDYITSLNAISLRIDGLIDFGRNWSYEYKVVEHPKTNTKNGSLSGHDTILKEKINLDKEMHRFHERVKPKSNHSIEKKLHTKSDVIFDKQKNPDGKLRTYSSIETSMETSEEDTPVIKGTKFDMNDFTNTKKPKTTTEALSKKIHKGKEDDKSATNKNASEDTSVQHKLIGRQSETRSSENGGHSGIGYGSSHDKKKDHHKGKGKSHKKHHHFYKDNSSHHSEEPDHNKTDNRNPFSKILNIIENVGNLKSNLSRNNISSPVNTVTTTTVVTTFRSDMIYSDPHKIKDDTKITEFTNHIYKQTLKVLDEIKKKTNEFHFKKQIDVLSRSYEQKFNEFIKETRNKKIKTRLGTQKVVLNTIEMSKYILKRLVNYMLVEMDRKGVLRNNKATANIIQKEIEKEQSLELNHACKKFGVCRTQYSFAEFLIDILNINLVMKHDKLKLSFDAFTEVLKNTHFNIFNSDTDRKFKKKVEKMELMHSHEVKPILIILKNIIANRNKPLVVTQYNEMVNATLAFLEIIDILDQNIPGNETNHLEWHDIKTSFQEFADDKRKDVQDIMETLIKHIKKSTKRIDEPTRKSLNKNLHILLGDN